MNKSFCLILAISFFPLAAQGYPGLDGKASFHGQKRLEHLTEKLNLSETQQQQVEQLWQQQGEKIKAIHQESQAGMQEILNPEQYAKLNNCKQERSSHGHGRRHDMEAQ